MRANDWEMEYEEAPERKRGTRGCGCIVGVFIFVLLLVGGYFGVRYYIKYKPSTERAVHSDVYKASGTNVAILYNNSLQKEWAMYQDGAVYLSRTWVMEYLNERFYYDESTDQILYALADRLDVITSDDTASDGAKSYFTTSSDIYLHEELVRKYTDIRTEVFTDGDVRRIYIDDVWGVVGSIATIKSKKQVDIRVSSSIKSAILTTLEPSTTVYILDSYNVTSKNADDNYMANASTPYIYAVDIDTQQKETIAESKLPEGWLQVRTTDGHVGYVQEKYTEYVREAEYVSEFVEPAFTWNSLGQKVVLAWHQVTTQNANSTLESMLSGTSAINVISPTWYSLTDEYGAFTSLVSDTYVQKAHEMGLSVWALVDNFNIATTADEDDAFDRLLETYSSRTTLIDSLVADVLAHDIDGINIDFELVQTKNSEHYIQFLRELSIKCREYGIILSVDNPNCMDFNLYYNRGEQGVYCDYVINMGYDEHTKGDPKGMGSTASLPFVQEGIDRSLAEGVPAEKLINALPFYTRIWIEKDGEMSVSALGMIESKQWADTNGVVFVWDEELGQNVGAVARDDGSNGYVWLEDIESIQKKMDYMLQKNVGGVAGWKLGLEDIDVWEVIGKINE
jgi:spore germination protein YaaH